MEFTKNNIKKILGIITFTVLLLVGVQKFDIVIQMISTILQLIFPFLLGAGIAFILNVPMRGIEGGIERLISKLKKKKKSLLKMKRTISLLISLIVIIGIIFLVIFLIVPEIWDTILVIRARVPNFISQMDKEMKAFLVQYPVIAEYIFDIELDWEEISKNVIDFMQNRGGSMLQSTFGIATTILGGLINFFLGFIFAIYILIQKEKLGRQSKKLLYAYLPEEISDKIISVCSLSAKTFSRFLSGQCMEAVIIGSMFFLAMNVFRFPYAMMIGVLIGFTALIPIFGAFIGCFIGTFLILIEDPIRALWFVILFLIIQQIEGNFIYPRVVGGSVGLPSMWVLVAVTIGGSTMGVVGMLIFIPMTSVLYTLLREAVNKRLRANKVQVQKYNT